MELRIRRSKAENGKAMKTTSIVGGAHHTTAVAVLAHEVLWYLGVATLLTACSTARPPSVPRAPQATVSLAQLDPGTIVITSRPELAAISVDPPDSRMESAGEGAGDAIRSVLNTPNLGHPQLEAAVGVIEFAAVPFAGAYGAISGAFERLPSDEVSDLEHNLVEAIKANAGSEVLRDKVADVARLTTCRRLICAPCLSAVPASQLAASAVLDLAVEQLRLKVAKPGRSEYILCIDARARLRRAADGEILLDKSYQYQSGPTLWIDWARLGGLAGVVQTGYHSLAEQIAGDIFRPVSEPPLLIGPGQKHSSLRTIEGLAMQRRGDLTPPGFDTDLLQFTAPRLQRLWALERGDDWDEVRWQPVREYPVVEAHTLRFVSLVEDDVTGIEVYAGRPDQLLRLSTPDSGPGDKSGVPSDTEWALDGLENDRNSVVQLVACLAAVPMGLWEQTLGAVRLRSLEKTEKVAQALAAIPAQRHFPGELADEVARCLRSQVVNPVRRPEEPLEFALTILAEAQVPGWAGPWSSSASPLALHVQLVDAKLIGKHRNSRSRALCVELKATLIRTSDGQEVYSRPIVYRSSTKRLKEWAASDAMLFRQELGACSRQAAQALTRELIGRGFVTQGPGAPVLNPL